MLQGGEDAYFHDDRVCDIVSSLREHWPDCAVTLSIGEKAKKSYEAYFPGGGPTGICCVMRRQTGVTMRAFIRRRCL